MKSWKKALATLSLAVLTIGMASSYAADIEDEQWHASADLVRMQAFSDAPHSVVMEEVLNEATAYSYLYAETFGNTSADFTRYICKSTKDAQCKNANRYAYSAIFPTCTTPTDLNCVVGLSAIDASGNISEANFTEYSVKDHPNNFESDIELGIPRGVTGGIWDIPGAPHSQGTKYGVFVIAQGAVNSKDRQNWGGAFSALSARIVPISIKKTEKRWHFWGCEQDEENVLGRAYKANTRCGAFYDQNEGFRCIAPAGSENDKCLSPTAFPENTRFKLKVRLASAPVGWLHGRMIEPSIEITQEGLGYEITVESNPARIPSIFHADVWSKLPANVQTYWNNLENNCMDNSCGYRSTNNYGAPMGEQTSQINSLNYGTAALDLVKNYIPLIKDTAIASPSTWSWRTLSTSELQKSNGCFTEGPGVKGIVTTNASAYSAGPPEFKDGSLNYQVAAPHFNRDGTVFKGDYTLVLDSKVARCLYKFSNAPIQATISVVNDKGEQSVATTTVTENKGWLRLVARNFEFSSPSISVKLTQEAPAKVEAAAPQAPAKKVTITCIKGKTTKKVTATYPKCPTGYKKK